MRRNGRPRTAASLGYGLLAIGLVASPLVGPVAPAAAADVVVSAVDFEDGTTGPWAARGASTQIVENPDGDGHGLLISGRTAGWQGIGLELAGLLEPGDGYTFSARARLAPGAAPGGGAHFTVEQRPAEGSNAYVWVGDPTALTDSWVTLTGAYSLPAGLAGATAYLDGDGGPYPDLLIDDIVITGPPAGATVVTAVDFEDSTTGAWTQSGGAAGTLTFVPGPDGGTVLSVNGRDADYVGIQSPTGIFAPGATYQLSMKVRLAEGTAGSAAVRFVMKPAYEWIGTTTMTADAWTTVTGTWTAPDDADPAALQLYIGTGELSPAAPYTYLVDDVVVTTEASGLPPLPSDFVPGGAPHPVPAPEARADGVGNVAALTFDDGPNPGTTPALLDFLAAHDLKATFCVIGQNVEAAGGAQLLRRIVDEGHTLCNHTTSYADMGSWTPAQVQADLLANLRIIRDALGDPYAKVPYFRAPNGSWGQTPAVAVAMGMQPLAVVNTIDDWSTQDVPTLVENLRAAMKPGEIVLAHDGGGDRSGTLAAVQTVVTERLADGWQFVLPVGAPPPVGEVILESDFEDGTAQGWTLRDTNEPTASLAVIDGGANGSAKALAVSSRDNQGDGPQYDVTALADPGVTYEWEAWMRFADGQEPGDLTLSARTVQGTTEAFSNLTQITAVGNEWTLVGGEFTMPAFDTAAELYVETRWANGEAGNTSTFYLDDVRVEVPPPPVVQDLTPLRDTVDFPVGVAIDSRETGGSPSALLLRHFDQVTAENHMKPEAWYDAERNFRPHGEAAALMDYAQENDLRLYGHVLVWHSQTPEWFFQRDDGTPLTSSEADQQVLRDRLHDHIFDVAGWLAGSYGAFGSDTNPLVAFDVVNEVVADGADNPDGLRRSAWFNVLGEEYIRLAFQWADEAFNDVYAADGADRPVALFINDYDTEQGGKQDRYFALVKRLLDAGVPVDGVGHQFHLSVTAPVASLAGALDRFAGLGPVQAVTELDVTLGTTVTQALRIEQGYFYRDAFRAFRQYQAAHGDLFSVTLWGLTDGRSWRSEQEPLLFNAALQAKPAYYGAVDGELPALLRSANVFGGDVALGAGAFDAVEWRQLPAHRLSDEAGSFGLRWTGDHLSVLLDVAAESCDAAAIEYGDAVYTVARDGSVTGPDGTAASAVALDDAAAGWRAVVHVPHAVAQGDTGRLDVRVLAGDAVVGAWNSPGSFGDLAFLEPLSYLEVAWADEAPAIDATVDDVWADAATVSTATLQSGAADGATAQVRTLWRDDTLYVLAEVTDPVIDVSSSDAYQQDSVELFVDAGNAKNGAYRPEDSQMRISATNVTSFGTGDAAAQAARLTSATALTGTGYRVEAAIDLLGTAGPGTFHGLDFQVNDGTAGTRTSVHSWAEPTGTGYQTTARWGVGQLLAPPVPTVPAVTLGAPTVPAGQRLSLELTGFEPGARVAIALEPAPAPVASFAGKNQNPAKPGKPAKPAKPSKPTPPAPPAKTYALAKGTVGGDGTLSLTVTIPKQVPPGRYLVAASVGREVVASAPLTVTPPLVAPTVTKQPASVTARAGTTARFVAAASGNPAPTVQWQSAKGRGGWQDVAGATSPTLVVQVAKALDGTQYRAVFANAAGTAQTRAATLTVKPDHKPAPPRHHGGWWPVHGPGSGGCRGPVSWF